MEKLPVEFKTKWVEALRSGEYLQCQSQLKGDAYQSQEDEDGDFSDAIYLGEGYCCLGVACAIVGIDLSEKGHLDIPGSIDDDENLGQLPDLLLEPYVYGSGTSEDTVVGIVATMNDEGSTFVEIAQWIEENL